MRKGGKGGGGIENLGEEGWVRDKDTNSCVTICLQAHTFIDANSPSLSRVSFYLQGLERTD